MILDMVDSDLRYVVFVCVKFFEWMSLSIVRVKLVGSILIRVSSIVCLRNMVSAIIEYVLMVYINGLFFFKKL